ncbi:MAG: Tellurium resistance protein TerA [Alphaproteobacteria bacterium]|nr:Tellurium resistance protein TerA [Alphaproteobacteria bacterium]
MKDQITTSLSESSLKEATRYRSEFSHYIGAKGAAGYVDPREGSADIVTRANQKISLSPPEGGFNEIRVGAAWDNQVRDSKGFFGKLLNLKRKLNIDLDLGCLYELNNGKRGAVQAFGSLFGNFDQPPYFQLSGDERTGDSEGDDEYIRINGSKWHEVKRALFYIYIYKGEAEWGHIRPQIVIDAPGSKPIVVRPSVFNKDLRLCVIAGLENVRNGIQMTSYTEYFPGHVEMDRAYGYGLQWDDGEKR